MIYQMTIYYGALLNGQVIYSLENNLTDCRKFPDEIDGNIFKKQLRDFIQSQNLNPDDFEYSFLTKEQYENRITKNDENKHVYQIDSKESMIEFCKNHRDEFERDQFEEVIKLINNNFIRSIDNIKRYKEGLTNE